MVSTALDETLTSRLPLGLEKLTLCSHPEFAPLEQTSVGQKVISRPQKAALHDLSVYNPSNESVDLEELTKTLSKRSIQCSRIQNDVEGA